MSNSATKQETDETRGLVFFFATMGFVVYCAYYAGYNTGFAVPRPCDASQCVLAHIDSVIEVNSAASTDVDYSALVSHRERYESASEQAYQAWKIDFVARITEAFKRDEVWAVRLGDDRLREEDQLALKEKMSDAGNIIELPSNDLFILSEPQIDEPVVHCDRFYNHPVPFLVKAHKRRVKCDK